jgi:hypothetical protein
VCLFSQAQLRDPAPTAFASIADIRRLAANVGSGSETGPADRVLTLLYAAPLFAARS